MKRKLLLIALIAGVFLSFQACKGIDQKDKDNGANQEDQNGNQEDNADTKEGETNTDVKNPEDENEQPGQATDNTTNGNVTEEEFKPADVSSGGWNVVIEDVIRKNKLENISVELGYTDATTNEFIQEAKEGFEYILIKMNIKKSGSKENIKWTNMIITDQEGNVYNRIDDTFLTDLGLKRLPGTDLNFGTNDGWIAYEVKEGAEGLTLQYEFTDETLEYSF